MYKVILGPAKLNKLSTTLSLFIGFNRPQKMKYQTTLAQAFTYRGWYCSIQEALGGYRVDAVAMTSRFQSEYFSNLGFKYAKDMKHCGPFQTFKVYQLFIGYGRAIKKAKSYIDEHIGDAPVY